MGQVLSLSIFTAAIGSAILGGFFLSWSNLVMPALDRIPATAGIAAMNATNVVVYNPLFFLLFLGVPLLCAGLAIYAATNLGRAGSLALIAGAVLIVFGMAGVTMSANVPMNDALARLDPNSAAALEYWQMMLDRWTFWNHVRTLACLAAAGCFITAALRAA
ncbi:MAG TPA: anthrone oxygenase family protein [Rhizobiaceae bacterium]|nr:anthrone oxygenase family protein [Rhizobiaceae bacterium]